MPSLRRILNHLTSYKTDILLAIAGMFIGTLGMSLIPVQTQRIIDTGIGTGDLPFVIRNGLYMLLFGFLTMVGMYINGYFGVRVAQNLTADLRAALYHHIQTLSFGNLDRLNTGNLLVRLTTDVTKVQQLVMSGLGILLMAPLLFVWGIVMIYVTAPELAVILWAILPVAIGLMIFFGTRSQPMYRVVQQRLSRLNIILQENLAGIRTVKSFVRGNYERERFGEANHDLAQESIDVNQFVAWVMPTLQMTVNVGLVAVIWFGGNLAMQGEFTAGQIVAFINYLGQALMPMMFLGQILPQIAAAEASSARILEVMDSNPDIQDGSSAQDDTTAATPAHGRIDGRIDGRVVFENVTFSYTDNGDVDRDLDRDVNGDVNGDVDDHVLSGLNLVAEPGQTVAILGATGSGKSSLVNLIPRFYDVDGGRITIDGVDIREIPQSALRAHIGICLQEAILFSNEISTNIRYGASELSEEEMVTVAQAADAHNFIQGKSHGYKTVIGQRGVDLSGGQRQRVSIARALARRPKILILDDSTSAVDVATERRIQAALGDLTQDCTTFIVAQRISTVLGADKIIVLENGRIVAEGTHAELIESSRHYQEIYESQLGTS